MMHTHEPELPFGHPSRNFDDIDDRYNLRSVDPPKEDIVHYGPGTSRYAALRPGSRFTATTPPGYRAAKTAWNWSRKTRVTRTTTSAGAYTAGGRAPPRWEWHGAELSGRPSW